MKNGTMKRVLCAILCVLMAAAFAACGAKKGVDIAAKVNALMVTDQTLGIAGKYTKLPEVEGGSIDADLVGTWVTADGDMTYTYGEDGTLKVTTELYGDSELPYTCVTIGEYKILCEEMQLDPEMYEGAKEGDTMLSYTAYSVEKDVLYQVVVEEVNEDYTSHTSALVTLYRADESGSAAAAIAANPIDIKSLNGTWVCDKGSFTIADGTLKLGEDTYTISLDEKNDLVVEKDGKSTAYNMAVSVMKEYDYEDRTQFTASTGLGISYTGAGENDQPNLASLMESYEYNGWYFSGSFKLLKDGEEVPTAASAEDVAFEEDAETVTLFQKGVWSASVDGAVDTYFVFYDEFNGRTERADGTGGVPFTCEQNGWDVVFHFGSEDDVTNATFSEGDNTGTFDYGDRTVTYTFEAVADADADTFEVPVE